MKNDIASGGTHSARFVSRLTRNTLALILAGGRGSRLGPLTNWRAKPAVPFGGKFRIIDFALSNCLHSGIRKISVLTQYKSHSLIRHLVEGWNGLNNEYGEFLDLVPAQQWLEDEHWYLGTADAVYQSLDIVEMHNPEYVLVLAGDHIYKMDYGEMLGRHVEMGADLTVACHVVPAKEAKAFGVMQVDDQFKVRGFQEKPALPDTLPDDPENSLVSMGIYVFSLEYLARQLRRDASLDDSSHDFGRDIIPHAVKSGDKVLAYALPEDGPGNDYWRDVGTIDAFYVANQELLTSKPPMNLFEPDWPIYTYQCQMPPAKFTDHGPEGGCKMMDSMASAGCEVSDSTLIKSLLFSGVTVDRHCHLDGVLALPDSAVGESCRLTKVLIDNGCHLPAGTVIGENPEEDAKRFHRTDGGVVLVNREMLGQERTYQPAALYGGSLSTA